MLPKRVGSPSVWQPKRTLWSVSLACLRANRCWNIRWLCTEAPMTPWKHAHVRYNKMRLVFLYRFVRFGSKSHLNLSSSPENNQHTINYNTKVHEVVNIYCFHPNNYRNDNTQSKSICVPFKCHIHEDERRTIHEQWSWMKKFSNAHHSIRSDSIELLSTFYFFESTQFQLWLGVLYVHNCHQH